PSYNAIRSTSYLRLSALLSFSFNATTTTQIYTLSLHDALPICIFYSYLIITVCILYIAQPLRSSAVLTHGERPGRVPGILWAMADRKSTRLNSSHVKISYAVFCLKNKRAYYSCSLR